MKTKPRCAHFLAPLVAALAGGCAISDGSTIATTGDFPGVVVWDTVGKPRAQPLSTGTVAATASADRVAAGPTRADRYFMRELSRTDGNVGGDDIGASEEPTLASR
jgi:hypothetical protein